MTDDRNAAAVSETSRNLNHALAALREAAECLEDVAAAEEQPSLGVASALSHVVAARKALRPHGFGAHGGTAEQDAA